MQKLLPVLLIVLVAAVGGYYFLENHKLSNLQSPPIALPQGGVCDSETMTCSDGTILKKTPPNCSFPPCPSNIASSSAITQGEQVISNQ